MSSGSLIEMEEQKLDKKAEMSETPPDSKGYFRRNFDKGSVSNLATFFIMVVGIVLYRIFPTGLFFSFP